MSSDSSSPTLPSETDVLEVSPFTGLAACTAPTASQQSPAIRPRVVQNDPHTTPVAKSTSAVLLDIDALPSPSAGSDIVTTELLKCAFPLTERALRYQRRDALRATHDVAAPTSPHGTISSNTIQHNIVPAIFPEPYRSNLTFTLQRNAPVLENCTNILWLQQHLA